MQDRIEQRQAKLAELCDIVASLVVAIRPIYESATARQRALVETIVGAAIWYIPKPPLAWTGYISAGALRAFHPASGLASPRLSDEHVYPRKVTAMALLQDQTLDGPTLTRLFCEKYGRVHLITPEENKAVTRHQRATVFVSPEAAYVSAGIVLLQVPEVDLRSIKRRDAMTIEAHLGTIPQEPPNNSFKPKPLRGSA